MNYLVKTASGRYYFRIRIPKRFQAQYSGKTEIRKSLHTQDFIEASYLAASLSFQLKKSWSNQMNDLLRSQLIIKTTINTNDGTVIHEAITEPEKDPEQELKALEVYTMSLQTHTSPVQQSSLSSTAQTRTGLHSRQNSNETSSSILLSQAIDYFIKEKTQKSSWTEATRREFTSKFAELIKVISDKQIHTYSRQDATKYLDYLQSKNLTPKTINKYTQLISSLFNYLIRHHNLQSNPFTDLSLHITKRPDQEKSIYTDAELKVLFENLKYNHKKPSRYWTPILMLFTGMRPTEISQLHKSNIVQIDNIYCIKLDDSIQLKTEYSQRIIPIHQKLIELGFIQYVDSIKDGQLFPDIDLSVLKKTGPASRFWNRTYHNQFNINTENKSIYSLRHNFITQLRNNDVSESYTAELAGHSKGTTMSYSRYAASGQIQKLHQIINLINYNIQFIKYTD